MRGTIDIIHPSHPGERRELTFAPSRAVLPSILGGLPDIIPNWNQWINLHGLLVPATVVGNADWSTPIQPFNLVATAVWHYIAATKGMRLVSSITGPVAVLCGDEDFLNSILTE